MRVLVLSTGSASASILVLSLPLFPCSPFTVFLVRLLLLLTSLV